VGNGNTPQKHAWRARIIVLTADRLGTNEIMHRTGKSKSAIWRWQGRFMLEGVDGLPRDKTRPPSRAPLGQAVIDRVVAPERGRSARRDDALDGCGHGQGGGHQRALGSAHLALAPRSGERVGVRGGLSPQSPAGGVKTRCRSP
jgi:hypothetical protein